MHYIYILFFAIFGFQTYGQLNVLAEKTFGGSFNDEVIEVFPLENNRKFIVGLTNSNDGDPGIGLGGIDIWVFKIDHAGTIILSDRIGGLGFDLPETAIYHDGKIYIAGHTNSNDNDFSGLTGGFSDGFLMCIDTSGNILWNNRITGNNGETPGILGKIPNGNFIVGIISNSLDCNLRQDTLGGSDIILAKFDEYGNYLDTVVIGGSGNEQFNSYFMHQIHFSYNKYMTFNVNSNSNDKHFYKNNGAYNTIIVNVDTNFNEIYHIVDSSEKINTLVQSDDSQLRLVLDSYDTLGITPNIPISFGISQILELDSALNIISIQDYPFSNEIFTIASWKKKYYQKMNLHYYLLSEDDLTSPYYSNFIYVHDMINSAFHVKTIPNYHLNIKSAVDLGNSLLLVSNIDFSPAPSQYDIHLFEIRIPINNPVNQSICNGDSLQLFGNYYNNDTLIYSNNSGTFLDSSVVQINVFPSPYNFNYSIDSSHFIFSSTGFPFYNYFNCDTDSIYGSSTSFYPSVVGNYSVIVNELGCVDTSDCLEYNYITVPEYGLRYQLEIYPNPNNGNFHVDLLYTNFQQPELYIYNTTGTLIYQSNLVNGELNHIKVNLAPSIYSVVIFDPSGHPETHKLVIE